MIGFSCPHCGVQLQVKESLAGQSRPCPGCSKTIRAPSPSGSSANGRTGSGARAGDRPTLRPPSDAEDTATSSPGLAPPDDYPFLAPPQDANEMGRLGPYRILKVLGTGAMGIVFQAEHMKLKRAVALKVMKPTLAAYPDFHRRFLREAQLAAAIDHEHVVTIYEVGEDRGIPFLSMKLLQGETLEDRLDRLDGRLPVKEALRIGREIAEGLAAAHERGLIHRDIKPANIWLEEGRDRVKIVDFGLARGAGTDAHFTQAGAVIGTPSYMAPEQANGEEVDSRCDLFSLGAVLYRTCTGRLPFDGKDTLSVLAALASKTPETPHRLVPGLPPLFSGLVMRLLAKDRDDRPQSAREVVADVESIERGEETAQAAPPPAPPTEAPKPPAAEPSGEKKKPKKARSAISRKKKQPKEKTNWQLIVLIAALVLLAVAFLVLVIGIVHRSSKRHATALDAPESISPDPLVILRASGQNVLRGARRVSEGGVPLAYASGSAASCPLALSRCPPCA
jgi:serine/threonine protein kinase